MTDTEDMEERPRDTEPNLTQERMDETGQSESDRPVDVTWEDDQEQAD
jgi:hypothetical protein